MTNRRYTDDDILEIYEYYDTWGVSIREVYFAFDTRMDTIYTWIRGIQAYRTVVLGDKVQSTWQGHTYTHQFIIHVYNRHLAGESISAIAREYGIQPDKPQRWIRAIRAYAATRTAPTETLVTGKKG